MDFDWLTEEAQKELDELPMDEWEQATAFDGLLNDMKMSQEDGEFISILNPLKVEQMKFAYLAIQKVLRESGCKAKVECKQLELAPDVGAVTVEGKEIDMRNLEWFCRAAEFADNTEVYPLKNGKVRMTFGFNNLLN